MKTRLLLAVLLLPVVAAPVLAKKGSDDGDWHHRHHGGIERLDTDRDGRISRAEFDAGRAARDARMAQKPERKRDDASRQPPDFATLDANRDGFIVRPEL